MKKIRLTFLFLVLVPVLLSALAGCGGGGGEASSAPPDTGGFVNSVEQNAGGAARQANLRMIDSAIQMYQSNTGEYPTSVDQLVQYFAGGIPADPLGGTYYIANQGGEAKAAVR